MKDGRWEMEDGRWEMEDGKWETRGGSVTEMDHSYVSKADALALS